MDFIYSSLWFSSIYWFLVGGIVLMLSVIAWRNWKTGLPHFADKLYLFKSNTKLVKINFSNTRLVNTNAASIILAKFLLLSSLVFISGCTGFSLPGSKPPEVKQPDLNIAHFIERFSLHTQEATAALTKLNRIEYAKLPVKPAKSSGLIPASLSKQITFGWTGPLDLYVKELARKSGYSFSTQGNRPPNPVLINIPEQQKSILDHLRESGYQAGPRALVQVDAKLQKIEVIYAN